MPGSSRAAGPRRGSSFSEVLRDGPLAGVASRSVSSSNLKRYAMSEPSSSAPNATTPAKPEVSPTRNLIGLIVLVVVVIVGGMQVMARMGYSSAVGKLNDRANDETKDLMSEEEAETLMGGKKPLGEAEKVQDGNFAFLKKTYTWSGPIKSYPLYAYYQTTARGVYLHHFETEEEKYVAEKPPAAPTTPPPAKAAGGGPPRTKKAAAGKKAEENKGGQQPPALPDEYRKAMDRSQAARPDDKKADEKAPTPRADEKAPTPRANEKAPTPRADDKKADDKAK